MNIDDLRVTASLARLNLAEDELAAAWPAFEQMLEYFAAMQAADNDPALGNRPGPADIGTSIDGKAQMAAPFFRADTAGVSPVSGLSDAMLDNSGERDGRFILIPNVL